jgi:hypothetical protein
MSTQTRLCIAVLIIYTSLVCVCFASASPVPRQEQNTRLILALEKVAANYQTATRATEENTRAVRELTQALRQR